MLNYIETDKIHDCNLDLGECKTFIVCKLDSITYLGKKDLSSEAALFITQHTKANFDG